MTVHFDGFARSAGPGSTPGNGGPGAMGSAMGALRPGPDQGPDAAPDYTPASWPEPVPLPARPALNPLGTVLIPPAERTVPTARPGEIPGAPAGSGPAPLPAPGSPAAQPVPPADPTLGRAAALELSTERLLRRAGSRGPRSLRLPFTGGGQEERQRLERIRTPLFGCHRIAVLGRSAQAGRSAVTLALGTLLATHRPDRVIALDLAAPHPAGDPAGDPSAVPLGARVRREHPHTLGDLLAALPALTSYPELRRFSSRAASGLEVLAELPGVPGGLDEYGYRQVMATLSSQYPVIIGEAGAAADGVRGAAVELADQLVICTSASVAGAAQTDQLLDELIAQGQAELLRTAITVIRTATASGSDRPLSAPELAAHFGARCRSVVLLPADGHLTSADELDPARLRPKARQACLELAALVGESMAGHPQLLPVPWGPAGR
ncbi:MinD/ParA family ATP-binding protein [Kitasatospora sp. NBC_01266]|uniref:MinD/ParA family ATP-binding protein n=1 Tax=Kitasatospora sp. NBC_01266 TaxID=2903572 RepID=UPI002E305199|nr:hypothetical protein [Kitasatospora sp. NBC_01266]